MINPKKSILSIAIAIFASLAAAEVPVIDDSENYALLEEQTITAPSSAPKENNTDNFYADEQALAHDSEQSNQNLVINDNLDTHEMIKNLHQEVQELRGQIEVLNHELSKLKEQQLAFYKDLDSRIQNKSGINLSENNPPPQPPEKKDDPTAQRPIQANNDKRTEYAAMDLQPTTKRSSPNTSPADEQISYLQAFELVKSKQFPKALTAMRGFIAKYPDGYYTANAQYWLGELYLAEKNYPDAISHFDIVLQRYPSSNKYSASLLKMGYALADTGRYSEAKSKLREVMKRYPDTNTSNLARNKLEEISSI